MCPSLHRLTSSKRAFARRGLGAFVPSSQGSTTTTGTAAAGPMHRVRSVSSGAADHIRAILGGCRRASGAVPAALKTGWPQSGLLDTAQPFSFLSLGRLALGRLALGRLALGRPGRRRRPARRVAAWGRQGRARPAC
jgi:hypothetical protein